MVNPRDLATAALNGIATLEDEVSFDVTTAIATNDVAKVWDRHLLERLAALDTPAWGLLRSQLMTKFGSTLSIKMLDKSVEQYRKALAPPAARAGDESEPWHQDLLTSESGKILPTMQNVAMFLEHHTAWRGVLAYNELTAGYEIMQPAPDPVSATPGTEIEDHFDTEATRWMECKGVIVKPNTVRAVVDAIARNNSYHPIKNYLEALPPWDGVPRIESWLVDYLGVECSDSQPNTYAAAVGEKFLVSAIARVYQPGCKADHLLILEGEQGIGKSSAVRILAGEAFFTDQLDALGGKDAMMQLRGVWIVELPELDVLSRAEMSRAKAFLTAQVERFRVPYGRRITKVPRQCVFVGTTNSDAWLTDETGGRRFWPVKCHRIDLAGLTRDRDQIWAEALVKYRASVKWWIEDDETVKSASTEQRARYKDDVWQEAVVKAADALEDDRGSASVRDILLHMGVDVTRQDHVAALRVARCLRVAGWRAERKTGKGDRRYRSPVVG